MPCQPFHLFFPLYTLFLLQPLTFGEAIGLSLISVCFTLARLFRTSDWPSVLTKPFRNKSRGWSIRWQVIFHMYSQRSVSVSNCCTWSRLRVSHRPFNGPRARVIWTVDGRAGAGDVFLPDSVQCIVRRALKWSVVLWNLSKNQY